jgi:tetratricopeptide (TPR) repeat protein
MTFAAELGAIMLHHFPRFFTLALISLALGGCHSTQGGRVTMTSAAATPFAATAEKPLTQAEALDLLRANQFSELNKRYTEIQNSYKSRMITDEQLLAAFRVFYATDATLESKYALWVEQTPRSYVAHLARGIYYKKLGQERRGGQSIGDTTQEQLAGMETALKIASEELHTSLSLDDKPLLSYLHGIHVHMYLGETDQIRALLDGAIKIDPQNSIVRQAYMDSLETRWGGSVAEMRQFLDECRKAGLSPSHLQGLEAQVQEDEGWSKQYQEGDLNAAAKAYLKAAQMKPENSCKPCGPIAEAADAFFNAGNFSRAIELYSKVLADAPDSISNLDHRGFSELQVGKAQVAIVDFTRAANLGDAYAMDMLGRMFLLGTSVPQDRVTADMA